MKTEEELAKLEKEKLEKLEVISLLEGILYVLENMFFSNDFPNDILTWVTSSFISRPYLLYGIHAENLRNE